MPTSNVRILNESDLDFANFHGADFVGRYPGASANGLLIAVGSSANYDNWPHKGAFSFIPGIGEYNIAIIDTLGKFQGQGSVNQQFNITVDLKTPVTPVTVQYLGSTITVLADSTVDDVVDQLVAAIESNVNTSVQFEIEGTSASGRYRTIHVRNLQSGSEELLPSIINASLTTSTKVITATSFGDIIELYELGTMVPGARNQDGSSKYLVDRINRTSKYIYINPDAIIAQTQYLLEGGVDDNDTTLVDGFDILKNAATYPLDYLFGAYQGVDIKKLIEVVNGRRDCIGFIAPEVDDVVNQGSNTLENVINFRQVRANVDTTYVFCTDNWARVWDNYNGKWRWIPTTGGTAGLRARTDRLVKKWASHAGFQKGVYDGYDRLAWSADEGQRDELYKLGVNSIVDFEEAGFILFGDKMMTTRPTAFSRINVRAAFLDAELTIANYAKFYFFEFNNANTQAQFLNAVRPFLRNRVTDEAFAAAKVIADDSVNTDSVKEGNKFIAVFKLKPLYSINYIDLFFDAVGSDVTFDEVEGGV